MSDIPFDQLRSQQVLIIPPGQVRFIRVRTVRFERQMEGEMESGDVIRKSGLIFDLEAVFPDDGSVMYRLWNRRSIGMWQPLIQTGEYRGRWVKIFRTGEGPTSDHVPTLMAPDFVPQIQDLAPG